MGEKHRKTFNRYCFHLIHCYYNNNVFSFNIQSDIPQNDYKNGMNVLLQVAKGV